jgi:hypothetical protein
MIDRIREICEENHAKAIVVLETPLAGETVDNGMGVESSLPRYALIFKYDKGYNMLNSELSYAFYDYKDIKVGQFDVDNVDTLDGMVEELYDIDKYEVKWKDESYKDPQEYKSELFREAVCLELNLIKLYSLKVTFDEIKRYCADKSCGYAYKSDFFNDLLRDHPDFDTVVNNRSFPGDSAKLTDMHFCENGVVFVFQCKDESSISYADEGYSDEELSEIVKKFEYSDSSNFKKLSGDLKESFGNIINDKNIEERESRPRVNITKFLLGRKRI